MDRHKLIDQMENVSRSLREQLGKNEVSSLESIRNSAKLSFQGLKAFVTSDDSMKSVLDTFKMHVESFENALEHDDREAAKRTLDSIDMTIKNLRSQAA